MLDYFDYVRSKKTYFSRFEDRKQKHQAQRYFWHKYEKFGDRWRLVVSTEVEALLI